MTSTNTNVVPDARIRCAFMNLLEALKLKNAEYHYVGAGPSTHTGKTAVSTGRLGLINDLKLNALYRRLGEEGGYISAVLWSPHFHLKLTENDGIEFTNGTRIFAVGLTGTKFVPNRDLYVFDTQEALIGHVVAVAKEWFELAGLKTHLGEK